MNMNQQAIDHAVLDAIRSLQLPDNDDLVGQIVQTYFDDSAELMLMLSDAVRANECETVRSGRAFPEILQRQRGCPAGC